jgi:PAS domain S-box-containing protein
LGCIVSRAPSDTVVVADSRVAQISSGIGWILIVLPLIVLSGWAFHVTLLLSVAPGLATMKPNTAAALSLAGLALLRRNHGDLRFYSLGVLVIGTVTVIEYLSNSDFGVDQLLFRDTYSSTAAGRMSQITSVGFMLLGSALALMKTPWKRGREISRALSLVAGVLGVIALLGYSYDTQALYHVAPYSSVALHTAIAFVIAAIGVQCANPAEGLVRQILANSPAGAMLRRLLPTALLIPYLLGYAVWVSRKYIGWELGFSLALLAASVMACLVVITLLSAKRVQREHLALRESEERFRLVANTAPVMIWMSGPDKLCNYFNHPWLEFTGRKLETELGNGWAEGVHPEDLDMCLKTYTEAFDRRESFVMRYRLRRHDGEYRWLLDHGVPRFDVGGSFAGYTGSCVDVTEQKHAEEALSAVSRRLIEAQEEERTRIARELHDDINQRLALLALNIDGLRQNLPDSAVDLKREFNATRNQVDELGRDIQSLSHRLHSSKLELLGLAVAADSLCRELSTRHGAKIDFHSESIPNVLPPKISLCLFRVLQEALQNAAKHSGSRHFQVRISSRANEIELTVHDSGIGFEPEEVIKGRGLGLTSMTERLKLVDGHLSIDSRPQHGTTIRARVPLRTSIKAAKAAG